MHHRALNPDISTRNRREISLNADNSTPLGTLRGMEILLHVVLLLHLVGFAALFGGAFVQVKGPQRAVNSAMVHGALTMLVSGLLLVTIRELGTFEQPLNHMKIGIKLLIMVAVTVLVLVNRKKEALSSGTFFAIAGLTLANAAIAVLW